MTSKDILARIGVVVAIVIAIIGWWLPITAAVDQLSGGITTGTAFPHGISVGNPASIGGNPTNFKKVLGGNCTLIAGTYNVTASSTITADCAITGVLSTDIVKTWFGTTTPAFGSGWTVTGSAASTTAGYVTMTVYNGTGANSTVPASIASSSVHYLLFATQ